jgi:hypothetical protein
VAVLCVVFLAGRAHDPGAFAASAAGQISGQSSPDVTTLETGITVERELGPREEHPYQLALTQGDDVQVVVEQRGVDVVVQARRPDGSVIADFQLEITSQGQEQVDIVADAGGAYVLSVKHGPGIMSGSYAIHVAGRRRASDADRSMQEAWALRTAAAGLESAARLDEARSLFERALAIAEALPGADDRFLGALMFDLAGNALESRDDARAELLYQRAIARFERAWGTEHPYPAMARSRLALLQQHAGQGPQAEALLKQATDVIERTLGTEHPWYAVCLTTQANLRANAGDLETAEAIERRALGILEKIGHREPRTPAC